MLTKQILYFWPGHWPGQTMCYSKQRLSEDKFDWVKISEYPKRKILQWSTIPGITVKSSGHTIKPFSVSFQFFHMSPQRGQYVEANKRGSCARFCILFGSRVLIQCVSEQLSFLMQHDVTAAYGKLIMWLLTYWKKCWSKWIELMKISILCWMWFRGPQGSREVTQTTSVVISGYLVVFYVVLSQSKGNNTNYPTAKEFWWHSHIFVLVATIMRFQWPCEARG